jgi:hypothetical protein
MVDSVKERRACERFIIPGAIVNYRKEGFLIPSKYIAEPLPVIDLSRGGVRFLSNFFLKVNTNVKLKIIVPDARVPVVLKGRVRWISTNPEKSYKYQIGIQFAAYGKKRGDNDHEVFQKIISLETKFLKKIG